ncbi:MAG TPA: hypothetical protein VGM56_10380, partial [Byssovorax sp.]
DRFAGFEPLAETLRQRAKQTVDVITQVPFPDLARADTASEEYGKYVARLDQVYQTCLPFLRKAVAGLFAYVGAEAPPSWPDKLPIVAELPPELVTVPPADSPELFEARKSLAALAEEDAKLAQEKERLALELSRGEGEIGACRTLDNEAAADLARASQIYDFAKADGDLALATRALTNAEQDRAARAKEASATLARYKKGEAAMQSLEAEQKVRKEELAGLEKQLFEQEHDEPVLFGKDAWTARVADLRARCEAVRVAVAQRGAAKNQLKIELASSSVDVEARGQESALADRTLVEARARKAALEASLAALGQKLGGARPVGATRASAEQLLATLNEARAHVGARLARATAAVRAAKEEATRALARQKQIIEERQRTEAMVASAEVAASEGRDEALRQLALQRRAAVERHAGEIVAGLVKSLHAVDAVFVDPAREALTHAAIDPTEAARAIEKSAKDLEPIVAALVRDLEPELAAQETMLAQIQREFCEAAAQACRAAWG